MGAFKRGNHKPEPPNQTGPTTLIYDTQTQKKAGTKACRVKKFAQSKGRSQTLNTQGGGVKDTAETYQSN